MSPPKVYSYVRISNADQRKGTGLQRQSEAAKRYAEEHGLVLDEALSLWDEGRSAFHGEHRAKGDLGQFLKLVEAGEIARGSVLIVDDLDRLSRQNPWEAQPQLAQIMNAGIRVVTTGDMHEYALENDNIMDPVLASMKICLAWDESRKKSQRLKAAWKIKRENLALAKQRETWEDKRVDLGKGRKLTRMAKSWLAFNKETEVFDILPGAAEAIRRMFELKLSGWSSERIAKTLNADPESWKPPKKHKKQQEGGWNPSYVERVLHDRALLGEFQPSRLPTVEENGGKHGGHKRRVSAGDVIEDYYPQAIDPGLFHQMEKRFRENTSSGKGTGSGGRKDGPINNLFTHVAKCGHCGSPMSIVPKGPPPKGGSYLLCSKARKGLGCVKAYVPYDKETGFEHLTLMFCHDLDAKRIMDEEGDKRAEQISMKRGELAGMEAELLSIEPSIERMLDDMASQEDKRVRERMARRVGEWEDRKEQLIRGSEELTREIDMLSRAMGDTQERLDSLKKLIAFMRNTKRDEPKRVELRLKLREELRRLIDRIDVFPEGLPKYTPKMVEEMLEAILAVDPELEYTFGFARVREGLHQRAENPKDYRAWVIHFASGIALTFWQKAKSMLDPEVDREELRKIEDRGEGRYFYMQVDGTVVLEEHSEEGVKTTELRHSEEGIKKQVTMRRRWKVG